VAFPELAVRVMGELGAECFCCPGHQPIAAALAQQVAAQEFRPEALAEAASEDEETQAVLAELLLSDTEAPDEEELMAAVQKLRTLHQCGVAALPWERALEGEEEDEGNEEPAAELEKVRRELMERLDRGEITPEDPLYQQYRRLVERVHGRGGVGFYQDRR